MKIAKRTIASTIAAIMIGGMITSSVFAATVQTITTNPHRSDVYDQFKANVPAKPVTVHTATSNPHRSDVFDVFKDTSPVENTPVRVETTNAHRDDVYHLNQK